MKYSVVSFLSAVALCSSANAANLYVNVSSYGTNCLEADPCSTIQMAVDKATAGDTINVAAGTYNENVLVKPNRDGLTITGAGIDKTVVRSAGGLPGHYAPGAPRYVPLDAVFKIVSADVTIEKLTVEHPAVAGSIMREIGIFVTPFAENVTIQKCKFVRNNTGEPTAPGSRGMFVIRAGGAVIYKNVFRGNYQDQIHVPGHDMEIVKNDIDGAPRLGIVIIQENSGSDNDNNIIADNTVTNSGSDAIQVQSDNNVIVKNTISGSGGAAVKLCGETDGDDTVGDGDCINPFDRWADASDNTVGKNITSGNVVDNGTGNIVD